MTVIFSPSLFSLFESEAAAFLSLFTSTTAELLLFTIKHTGGFIIYSRRRCFCLPERPSGAMKQNNNTIPKQNKKRSRGRRSWASLSNNSENWNF
jgi:hypothetical protein